MIHVLEALLGLWIAWLIRKALIAHYVRKRLCRACNGQPALLIGDAGRAVGDAQAHLITRAK